MADIKIDELLASLERLSTSITRTSEEFDEFGNLLTAEQQLERRRQDSVKRAIQEQERQQKEFVDALTNSTKKLVSFGGSLTSSAGSFGPLKDIVGGLGNVISKVTSNFGMVGKVIGGMTEAVTEGTKLIIEQFEKAYATFEKISDTGVIRTFDDLKSSAQSLGLTYQDTERVLSKNSRELAQLGGSAIKGRQQFDSIANASKEVRRDFQKLGVGAAEFSEYQLAYVMQQQRASRGQLKSTEQLVAGSEEYIEQLDAMSKLTGQSRKTLQEERDARMRDVRFRAGIATLGQKERTEITNLLDLLGSIPETKGLAEGLKDAVAGGGTSTTQAFKDATSTLNAMGINITEFSTGLRSGSKDAFSAFNQLTDGAGKGVDATKELAKVIGPDSPVTKNFIAMMELEMRKGTITKESFDEMVAATKGTKKETTGLNSELADAKVALYNTAINLEQAFTASGLVTGALKLMATGLETVTGKLYGLVGVTPPKAVSPEVPTARGMGARRRGAMAASAAAAAEARSTGGAAAPASPSSSAPASAPPATAMQTTKQSETGEPPGTNTSRGAQGKEGNRYSEADLIKMGLKIKQGDVQAPDQYLSPKLLSLAQSVQAGLPGFSVFSGFNDRYHHKLRYVSNHTKGVGMDFTLARPPSKEEGAKIIGMLKGMGASKVMDEYNFPSSAATAGHIHAEVPAAANGAIISPRTGGSLVQVAEAGQSEAIVPLPDGRSIPVIIKNSGDMSAGMGEAFMAMTARLDTMINLLASGNKYTRNIAQNIV